MRYAWIKERVMWTEQIRINRQWSDHRANNCLRERTQIRAKGAATTCYHQTSLGADEARAAEGDAAAKLGRARNGTTEVRLPGKGWPRSPSRQLGAGGQYASPRPTAASGGGRELETPCSGLGQRESGGRGTKRKGLQVCPIANGHDETGEPWNVRGWPLRTWIICSVSVFASPFTDACNSIS